MPLKVLTNQTPASNPLWPLRRGVALAIALALIGVLLALFDHALVGFAVAHVPPDTYIRRVFKIPNHFFSKWGFLVVPLLLLLDRRRLRLLIGFGVAVGSCLGVVYALKYAIGRVRPEGSEPGAWVFRPLGLDDLATSFPSAHAAAAVLLIVLMAIYWRRSWWVVLPLGSLACASRVVLERHFPSDVLIGAALAVLAVTLWTYRLPADCYARVQVERRPVNDTRSTRPVPVHARVDG